MSGGESLQTRHQSFISSFVTELYAILIGLGIANVIFSLKLEWGNWLSICLAVFVTVIVALYWWDWAAYVEHHFVATSAEFAIDFAALIVLEFLFVHFQDPVKLAGNFLALGVVDMVWVLNHIRQDPAQSVRLRKRWVGQKTMALVIYAASLVLVLSLRGSGPAFAAACVVVAAILVRVLCFGEVRRTSVLEFRPARTSDVARINSINQHYVEGRDADHFLLERLDEETIKGLLKAGPSSVWVATIDEQVVAYAKVSREMDEQLSSGLKWLDPELARGVQDADLLHIQQVAVDPGRRRQGVGRSLYDWLVRSAPNAVPCAFVAIHPRCNTGSLRFHAAFGFEKAALFEADEFCGESNYRGVLLVLASRLKSPTRS